MTVEMTDKIALVTGGSSGIGAAAARAFAAAGANVVIASRDEGQGQAVVQTISEAGGQAIWVQTDVTQAAQVAALIEQVVERYGRLDYAFNNAGSGGKGGWTAEIAEADWYRTIDGYLKSVWLCMMVQIPVMLEQGGGAIVNNSRAG